MQEHENYMRTCLELAREAAQRGDAPVGSVVVRQGQVIARGIEGGKTHRDITFHAEIEAIRQATALLGSMDLSDCTLYTTHEPCIMCAYVIRQVRLPTVVMGVTSGEIGGLSSAYPLLADTGIRRWAAPPRVVTGVLEQECRELSRLTGPNH
ncbi:nucleoside deaminase [Paraflavisolibacter sp. H34]|uniref:nucleoside deaminase n=1 Tax=Huijunlia imazamoxiresistens TaxID=3127457 RepID=UPI003016A5AA